MSYGDPLRTRNYVLTEDGITWLRDGTKEVQLTNFSALITADVQIDDGAEVRRVFEITAGENARFNVPADRFRTLNWATEHLGAKAIVRPGMGLRDHTAVAIQELSAAVRDGEIPRRKVYAHTGWRKLPGGWGYLTASGAMMASGLDTSVSVELGGSLGRYELPAPGDPAALRQAVLASLAILDLADDSVTVPLLAAVYRAPLPVLPTCTPWLRGASGALKTALCSLGQQHFGPQMDAQHLPGSWESTANALEMQAHAIAGAVFVVDDYRPDLSAFDARKRAAVADRLLRGSANQGRRDRLRSDTTQRPERPARAQLLCSAEDLPPGVSSLRARTMISQVPRAPSTGAVDLARLTVAQQAADSGVLAVAMAGYVQQIAGRHDAIGDSLHAHLRVLRDHARSEGHLRTAENIASLYLGWDNWLAYATLCSAISPDEAQALRNRTWKAMCDLGADQAQYLDDSDHVAAFLRALNAIISSGRGHLSDAPGQARFGFDGDRLGWACGDDVYLDPDVCYRAARKWAEDCGTPLGVSRAQLQDDMKERAVLASAEHGRTTVRPVLEGRQRRVLHLTASTFESYGQ